MRFHRTLIINSLLLMDYLIVKFLWYRLLCSPVTVLRPHRVLSSNSCSSVSLITNPQSI